MRQWKAAQAGDWATVKAEQDRLNEISHIWDVTSGVQAMPVASAPSRPL